MKSSINSDIEEVISLFKVMARNNVLLAGIEEAATIISECCAAGGKVLIVGNGGSAATAQHLAAELVGRYKNERHPLSAIALTVDPSVLTAIGNDYGFDRIFARQVAAHGTAKDVLVAISTSGHSTNVLQAAWQAKELKMTVIGLLGGKGGDLGQFCDCRIFVPSESTPRIQEVHDFVIHSICKAVDQAQ